MTQAFSRIEASKSAASVRMSDAFKNEAGAFDLPSILVGVVVVGVLTAGVLASIFGVIPFAQDKGAQQDIGAVTTAQGVYKAQTTEGLSYGSLATLQSANLLGADIKNVASAGDSDEWATVSKSNSGQHFVATSKNSTPVKIAAPTYTAGADTDAKKLAEVLATVWDEADNNVTVGTSGTNYANDGIRIIKK